MPAPCLDGGPGDIEEFGGGGLSPSFRWLACAGDCPVDAGFVDIPEPVLLLCILAADRFRDNPMFALLLLLLLTLVVGVVGLVGVILRAGTDEGFLGVSAGTSPGPKVAYMSSISSSFGKGRTGSTFPLLPRNWPFSWFELAPAVGVSASAEELEPWACVPLGGVRGAGPGDLSDDGGICTDCVPPVFCDFAFGFA